MSVERQSIRCAAPFCTRTEEEQTKCSLLSRILAVGLGAIALLIAILALSGIPGLNTLSIVNCALLMTIGGLILLTSLCLRCVKRKEDYSCNFTSDQKIKVKETPDSARIEESIK